MNQVSIHPIALKVLVGRIAFNCESLCNSLADNFKLEPASLSVRGTTAGVSDPAGIEAATAAKMPRELRRGPDL